MGCVSFPEGFIGPFLINPKALFFEVSGAISWFELGVTSPPSSSLLNDPGPLGGFAPSIHIYSGLKRILLSIGIEPPTLPPEVGLAPNELPAFILKGSNPLGFETEVEWGLVLTWAKPPKIDASPPVLAGAP